MSVQDQINRLETAKQNIAAAIGQKGVTVPESSTLDTYGDYISQIQAGGGGGKRTCRIVVGTSTAGWTASDCDYLCDGTSDESEINTALQSLPADGGDLVILDGTYNIADTILVDKPNTRIIGSGAVIQDGSASLALGLSITQDHCTIDGLQMDKSTLVSGYIMIKSTGASTSISNCILISKPPGASGGTQQTLLDLSASTAKDSLVQSCSLSVFPGSGVKLCDGVIDTSNIDNTNYGTGHAVAINGGDTVTVQGCHINGDIDGSATKIVIANNHISNHDTPTINVGSITFAGNIVVGGFMVSGSYTSSTYSMLIDGNYIDGGLNIDAPGSSFGSGALTISNNIINGMIQASILIPGAIIQGNVINNGFIGLDGYDIPSLSIVGNVIREPVGAGILGMGTISKSLISGNTFAKSSWGGSEQVIMGTLTSCLIEGNISIGKNIIEMGNDNTIINNKY